MYCTYMLHPPMIFMHIVCPIREQHSELLEKLHILFSKKWSINNSLYHRATYKLWSKSFPIVAKTNEVNVWNCKNKDTGPLMALKIYGLKMPFVFLSLLHAMLTKDFKADGKLDNKVSVHPAIGNSYTESLINCTILSRNSSECFSFNSQTGMCRRYCSCDPSDMTVTDSGWRLYNNLSPEWMGMYIISLSVSLRTGVFYIKRILLSKYEQ